MRVKRDEKEANSNNCKMHLPLNKVVYFRT